MGVIKILCHRNICGGTIIYFEEETKTNYIMSNTNKVLGALLIGAAAGAVLGILFAPDKGTETRKKWMDSANDLADDLKSKIKEGKNLANQLKDSIVTSTQDLYNKAKDEAGRMTNSAKEEANRMANNVKNSVHNS